jgi:Protein of unknown function (DUF3467)
MKHGRLPCPTISEVAADLTVGQCDDDGNHMSEPFVQPPNIEGVPIVYTNLLRTIPSPFEFGLDFGYIAPSAEMPLEAPRAQLRVVMSWEYAKLLRDMMQEAIENRESNVGEIQQPPGILRVEHNPEGGEE